MTRRSNNPADEDQVRQALRQFFGTVDEALQAAAAAQKARQELERLTGRQMAQIAKSMEENQSRAERQFEERMGLPYPKRDRRR